MTLQLVALVYQGGIANIFAVDSLVQSSRNARRVLQHAFSPCEWYARGAIAAGAIVHVYSCNFAGDISTLKWTDGLSDCPFRNDAKPPKEAINAGLGR